MGFKTGMKFKDISPEGWEKILEFWRENQGTSHEVKEPWDEANIYVNHWEVCYLFFSTNSFEFFLSIS